MNNIFKIPLKNSINKVIEWLAHNTKAINNSRHVDATEEPILTILKRSAYPPSAFGVIQLKDVVFMWNRSPYKNRRFSITVFDCCKQLLLNCKDLQSLSRV
jgi:hypothetical protein